MKAYKIISTPKYYLTEATSNEYEVKLEKHMSTEVDQEFRDLRVSCDRIQSLGLFSLLSYLTFIQSETERKKHPSTSPLSPFFLHRRCTQTNQWIPIAKPSRTVPVPIEAPPTSKQAFAASLPSPTKTQQLKLDGWIDGRTDVTGEGGAVAGFDDTASKVRVQRRTGDGDAEDERRFRLSEMIPKYHLNPWICSDASRASACSLPQNG
ncbi:hypothetical protein LXL04_028481 [Taraxacum kok-saghyz]